jgi:DNA-binding response OmpR family regulator
MLGSAFAQRILKTHSCAHPVAYPSGVSAVLLVEDDPDLRRLVSQALAAGGHHVESASAAMEGLKRITDDSFDIVILDLGLPDLDGGDLLKMIRAVSDVPIIVATARGTDEHVVATLDAGADDYLVKPFSVGQLQARVRAVLRRRESGQGSTIMSVGELTIDVRAREVRLEGMLLDLSPKEFDLLTLLAERNGEVVSKREMLAEVWRQPYGGGDRTIDVHLSWLRKKLGESATDPRYLRTVHGVGVKLVDPDR